MITQKTTYFQFMKIIFTIAVPIMIQNFITSGLGMLDGVMLSHLGNKNISSMSMVAVNQANRSLFVIFLLYFGIAAGSSVFFSQFFGKKDSRGIQRILGIAISVALLISTIPVILGLFFPHEIIALFVEKSDTQTFQLAIKYFSIIAFSYPLISITMIYGFALRSINQAKVPMIASIVSLVLNFILNYLFIFGWGFIPSMGVVGAAIGTFTARIAEFFIILGYIYIPKTLNPLKASLREIFSFKWLDIQNYFKTSFFVIMQEGLWGLGMTFQFALFGHMGRSTAAAVSVLGSFIELSLVSCFAIGQAVSVVIGNMIGSEASTNLIKQTGKRALLLSFVSGSFVGVGLGSLFYHNVSILYNLSDDILILVKDSVFVFSVFLALRSVEMTFVIGIFRGGGDSRFGVFMDFIGSWLIMLPIVFITGYLMRMPLPYVQGFLFTADIFTVTVMLFRIQTDKWIKNITYSH